MTLNLIFIYIILSLIFLVISLINISFLTLWERKLLAGIQRRQGPVFVGIFGILQPFADGLKLAIKAVNVPQGAYYYVFFITAISSLTLSLLSWTVIPLNSEFVFADNSLSLLLVLAISSLNVYSILFSGWSSNSKYGLLGSIRAGAQLVSYEIPMTLSFFPIILLENSFNIQNIVLFQMEKDLWNCYMIPLVFIFFISALAETNRTPFDLPEAESELVAGYNIEYSALLFAVFFLAEYNHIILMSVLTVNIYFGGWSVPWINLQNQVYMMFDIWNLETVILIIKSMFFVSFFIVIRASIPRYKFTDLIIICWESLIPISILQLVLVFFIKNNI